MVKLKNDNFSLHKIAASGQCFRMNETCDGKIRIIAKDKYLTAVQDENKITFDCTNEEFESFWMEYFDLCTDYDKFINAVDKDDKFLTDACTIGKGIRILKQDPYEMLISFLISQQNNIPRIKKCIENISRKYGKRMISHDGFEYYSFPEPCSLSHLDEDALMECNLGYRSKYVVRCSKMVANGEIDLAGLKRLDYAEAKDALLSLYGVGKKVADCICLFALHQMEAFPVDTHIDQVLKREYKDGFPFERYKGFEGVIQQYIFYNELENR